MKYLLQGLLLLMSMQCLGQSAAYTAHETSRNAILAAQEAAHKAAESKWFENNPNPRGGGFAACEGHYPLFWCRKHHKQCDFACSCGVEYRNEVARLDRGFEARLAASDAAYEKAAKQASEKQRSTATTASGQDVPSSTVTPAEPARDPNATVKEQHQQNAKSYLDAAENSTGLNKGLNLDLAKVEAISGGDKAQIQQVQQLQNKQQAENQLALTKSVNNLLTQLQTMQAQNAERRDREHQNLVAHSDEYLQLIDFHVNQKRIVQIRDLYSNAPRAAEEYGWDRKKIPEKYFTIKEWDNKPTNHLDSVATWTKQRNYKQALRFIGSITPYFINIKKSAAGGAAEGSFLYTAGTYGLMDMHYWGVFEHIVSGVLSDPENNKRRLKAFAKNTATPLSHYEYAFIKLRGNYKQPGDTAEAAVHFKTLINAAPNSLLYNAFLQKQAYLWLGLIAKSSAFQTGDLNKYSQAISYFDRAWQIPTATFLADGTKISTSQPELFNYSSALANDSYYQVLQLTLVRELAQAHYLLAEASQDKSLYEKGLNYYYMFANELTK